MIGLSEQLLANYVEWIANRRMKAIGLDPIYNIPAANNPLPWTEHWIKSKGVQVAPQETEVESYIIGGIKQDISENAFRRVLSMKLPLYEVWEYAGDSVKRIAMCGTEDDARMMMRLAT